ncbi:hypothetical protein ACIBBE_46545 [Streptomyces sp. NPDC051644]|uniref:hypothetical protein n=1 Tax=Streptomyces sp. NPDC051644 TaxID=3365666 RepID=UPI003793E461
MTFTWTTPPWLRNEDCTHMATTLTDAGNGRIMVHSESVRGDDANEALADLLMGPCGMGGTVLRAHVIGIVIRRGIDLKWMFRPPVHAAAASPGQWKITVDADPDAELTTFTASDIRSFAARLHVAYGAA